MLVYFFVFDCAHMNIAIHLQVHAKYVFCVFDGRWSRLPNLLKMFGQERHRHVVRNMFYTYNVHA